MQKPTNVTISTIAEKAGTSKMTVSRVINNHPYVSPKTRLKISALIKKFKFHPNMTAVNLSKMEPQTLALVIQYEHLFTNYYFSEILQGIEKAVDDNGYDLIILNYSTRHEINISHLTSWYYSKLIKGFIVLAPPMTSPLVRKLKDEHIPFIVAGGHAGFKNINYVDVDNIAGAIKATDFLIGLGHKSIGFIGGPFDRGDAREREFGFRKALMSHGLKVQESLMDQGDFSEDRGYQAMQRLLQNKIRLTAVFTANDLMAKGAITALRDSGLQVPKDVSVVGFDDINIASQMNPPLTTVKQPIFRLGEEAALFLIDYEEGQRNDFGKILPTELIVRESCSHLWNF